MKKQFLGLLALGMILFSGCHWFEPDNNYLNPEDFARKLILDGIKVDAVRPLNPQPVSATSALEIQIGNACIGVYKYDTSSKLHKSRLDRIKKNKRIYFNGIPYPIYEASGSFIVVGLDKHQEKERILESLRNFK